MTALLDKGSSGDDDFARLFARLDDATASAIFKSVDSLGGISEPVKPCGLRAGEPGIAQRGAFRCPTQQSIRSPSRENLAAHSPPSALGSKRSTTMLRRDGSGLPWSGKGEMLTQVERISKKIIIAAGLRPELTFTSFGRHGGATESKSSGLTTLQLMEKGQWSSVAAMANYLHDDDEGKQEAQIKRIKRRKRVAEQATVK
jgi:hypothetical protein